MAHNHQILAIGIVIAESVIKIANLWIQIDFVKIVWLALIVFEFSSQIKRPHKGNAIDS